MLSRKGTFIKGLLVFHLNLTPFCHTSTAPKQTNNTQHRHRLTPLVWYLPMEMNKSDVHTLQFLVGGFSPTHLKNMLVKLDHETPKIGMNIKNL